MILTRHAQSVWNLHFGRDRIDPGIPDAPLTDAGLAQARALVEPFRRQGIRRLVASPYRRALQTAAVVAEALALPVAVEPLVRERNAFSCDEGSPAEELARLWPNLDFAHLTPGWWGAPVETKEALLERCARFTTLARSWPDRDHVAVVSHWGFIRGLTGLETANAAPFRFDP